VTKIFSCTLNNYYNIVTMLMNYFNESKIINLVSNIWKHFSILGFEILLFCKFSIIICIFLFIRLSTHQFHDGYLNRL